MSDPSKRAFYNQHGINADADVSFVDPQQFFKQQFGGDKFVSLIGEISIARDFKEAMSAGKGSATAATTTTSSTTKQDEEDGEITLTAEEKIAKHKERVETLTKHLVAKLNLYTDAFPYQNEESVSGTTIAHLSHEALASFRLLAQVEVESLKESSYGIELLHAIGYTYTSKAHYHQALLNSQAPPSLFSRISSLSTLVVDKVWEKGTLMSF